MPPAPGSRGSRGSRRGGSRLGLADLLLVAALFCTAPTAGSLDSVSLTDLRVDDAPAPAPAPASSSTRTRFTRTASPAQRLLEYLSGYENDEDYWPLQSISSYSPVRRERKRGPSLRLLVLPAVAIRLPKAKNTRGYRKFKYVYEQDDEESPYEVQPPIYEYDQDLEDMPPKRNYQKRPPHRPVPELASPPTSSPAYSPVARPLSNTVKNAPVEKPAIYPATSKPLHFVLSGTPLDLVKAFRAYVPKRAGLPPTVQSKFDRQERIILPDIEDDDSTVPSPINGSYSVNLTASPPRPIFDKPLKLRVLLTVPRADYSEPYTAWWNPANGDSRIHFHEGSTVTFRKTLGNGLLQKTEMHVDRSTGHVIHDCAIATEVSSSNDRLNPALPDIQLFTFSGYEDTDGGPVERWEHTVTGLPGKDGGVQGEALTVHHIFLLTRETNEFVRPIRYTVSVDSSILGPNCDGYVHEYLDAQIDSRSPSFFEVDLDQHCSKLQRLNASSAEDLARLEPLHEFTLPRRDPRYDAIYEQFKITHEREYVSNVEEAVRKNLLMQTSRLVASSNRMGATFSLEANFLADRSPEEFDDLSGSIPGSAPSSNAETFPYTQQALEAEEKGLPAEYNLKKEGAVTSVRKQSNCNSCWAIAVTGAVEGALFRRTGEAVMLSEQTVIDCSRDGKGCNPTWPSTAYEYVKEKGLPRYQDNPYTDKEDSCKESKLQSVTRISGYVDVTANSGLALKVAIHKNGPVVVVLTTRDIQKSLKNGVFYDESCDAPTLKRHAVLAVGWGDDYFLLKNSWSEKWGEDGYFKLQTKGNVCGIFDYPSYPRLEQNDVIKK